MVVAAALRFGTRADALRALAVVTLFTLLPLAILMARQVRHGSWTNVDASERAERPLLFVVGLIGLAALLAYTILFHPNSFMLRGAIGTLALLSVCAAVTPWLKVSLHMAFGTLATTTLLLLGSWVGWALLAVVPVLAWSRVALKRHRPSEVAAGAIAGFGAAVAMLRF
jgi:membrane-associated phospholipid phosphatase